MWRTLCGVLGVVVCGWVLGLTAVAITLTRCPVDRIVDF